jgi:hypothetical protein
VRWLAKLALLWTPGFAKARACREMSAAFSAAAIDALSLEGESALAAFRKAADSTGFEAGLKLKKDLRLSDGFDDAELAWRLVTKMSGMKFRVVRGEGRSLFDHATCPMLEAGGAKMCRNFCAPFVEGLTRAFCRECRLEMVEEADGGEPCTKALVMGDRDNAG